MTKNELTTHIIHTYLITDDEGAVDLSLKKVKQVFTEQELKNIHKVSNHKNTDSMIEALVNSGLMLPHGYRQKIENMIDKCDICKKFKKIPGKTKSSMA